jgi:hypothetical protein
MQVEIDQDNWVYGCSYHKNRLVVEAMLACPGTLVQMVVMAPGVRILDATLEHFYYSDYWHEINYLNKVMQMR